MSEELPEDYPHDKAIYFGGTPELVELHSMRTEKREVTGPTTKPRTVTDMIVTWRYYDDELHEEFGMSEYSLREFSADGGVQTLYDELLGLPEEKVEDRYLLH